MAYGLIYKITNSINSKVYIGQTRYSIEKRFIGHIKKALQQKASYTHLQLAIRKYGAENFNIYKIDEAQSQDELNEKEKYWIKYYNSIELGYNMMDGGTDSNPMDSEVVKEKHYNKVHSQETRNKISKTMHELRTTQGFSEAHLQKLSKAAKNQIYFCKDDKVTHVNKNNIDKINNLLDSGWILCDDARLDPNNASLNNLGKIKCLATRSTACYCIVNNKDKFSFESILEGGKWWYDNYKPFGEVYSTATYRRKIEASMAGKEIEYGNKNTQKYIHITGIKWYKGE